MDNIYTYLDYHQWLAVAFKQKKAVVPAFSHRFIAQRLGLKSSGYILYVMQGKRKLTDKMAIPLASVFNLNKAQAAYFLQLIRYTDAKSSQEKQFHFERMITLRHKQVKTVTSEGYRFYEKWYYPVVREALELRPFTGNFLELAEIIVPPLRATEAAEAIKLLVELNMIERDECGIYHKKEAIISTGDVWQSAIIQTHLRTQIEKGKESLDTIPKSQRDISHITITASAATLELVAQRIANLRAEILELARNEEHPDRVLQCNFMVFPSAVIKEPGA